MNALSVSEKFASHQTKATVRITKEAEVFLKPLLPDMTEGVMKVFHQDVTEAAASLASIVRLFQLPAITSALRPIAILIPRMDRRSSQTYRAIDSIEVILTDLKSKPLKPGPMLNVTGKNVIGEQILLVQPGLYPRRRGARVSCSKSPSL